MTKAIAVEGPAGTILIELIAEPDVVATSTEGTAGARELADKLDQVGATIAQVCSSLQAKAYAGLQGMRPDSFELEFGVTLAGEAGIPLVTKGSAECTFKVTAKWGKGTQVGHDAGERAKNV